MASPSALDALYGHLPEPAHKRAGSGTHHNAVPRKQATHFLAEALAQFEVGHYPAADRAAQQLVDLLHQHMILQQHPWPHAPSKLDEVEAQKAKGAGR